jgi:hypothetical protein
LSLRTCVLYLQWRHLTPARLSLSIYSDRYMPSLSLSLHSCRTSFFFSSSLLIEPGVRACKQYLGNGFNGAVSKPMLGADRCMHVEWYGVRVRCCYLEKLGGHPCMHPHKPRRSNRYLGTTEKHTYTKRTNGVLRKNELKLIDLFIARNTGLTCARILRRRRKGSKSHGMMHMICIYHYLCS